MDKIKVNNQIVQMRKYVKQAKTRIINKCVKQIKLLENRKGDENQIAKCKRKAERLLSEVAILKKIKPDSVSKMALSKAEDWKAILNQKNIPLEERCFAMVANYEPVQREVEKFLSDNYYLVPKIPLLVQEWDEKAKLQPEKTKRDYKNFKSKSNPASIHKMRNNIEEKPMTVTQKTEEKVISENSGKHLNSKCKPPQNEKMEQDHLNINGSDLALESEKDDDSENENILNAEVSQQNQNFKTANITNAITVKHIGVNSPSVSEDELEKSFNKNLQKDLQYEKRSKQEQDSNLKPQIYECQYLTDTKKEVYLKTALSDAHCTKAVALLNLNELLDLDEIPIANTSSNTNFVPEVEKRKRDAFFLSDDGEIEPESSDAVEDEERNKGHSPPRKKLPKHFSKKDVNSSFLRQKQNSFHKRNESARDNFRNKQNSFHSEFNKNQRNNKSFYSIAEANISEKHQKIQQRTFKKNEKFNDREIKDDIDRKTFKSKERHFEKKQNDSSKKDYNQRNKGDTFNKKGKIDEQGPLHPSWEAKRKLKECAALKFQGKRIVFDD